MKHHNNKIIVWAVDPTQNPADVKKLITEMKSWIKRTGCQVQPVSVFSNSFLNLPVEIKFPWQEQSEKLAQNALDRYFRKIKFDGLLPTEKLFITSNSARKAALRLAGYAAEKKALLICANTRAKTHLPTRLGSFAENLMAVSKLPVLLMNPRALPSTGISRILFPTDFSSGSRKALVQLEAVASAFKPEILLYSQIEEPIMFASEYAGYWAEQKVSPETMMRQVEKSRSAKARRWEKWLREQNLKSRLIMHRQRQALAKDICSEARKKNADLIALANFAGPYTQSFIGSVARDVLLKAPCPVLIFFRPSGERIAKNERLGIKHSRLRDREELLRAPF